MKPKESQSERIINWLKARRGKNGRRLTSLAALVKFECWRLPSRIHELRNKGFNIITEMIRTKSKKRVAKYYLPLLLVLFLSSSCSNPVLKYNKTHKANFR